MYSIYDLYKSDLDERYAAQKERATNATGGMEKNISPFINNISTPQETAPEVTSGGIMKSLYDYNERGEPATTTADIWGEDFDWSQNPSPPIFDFLANNFLAPVFTMGATAGFGPLGGAGMATVFDVAKQQAKAEKEGKSIGWTDVGKSFAKNTASSFIKNYTPSIITNNPYINTVISMAKSHLIQTLVDKLMGLFTGNVDPDALSAAGKAGAEAGKKAAEWLMKGTGEQESALPSGTNMIGDSLYDPYGAVPSGYDTSSDYGGWDMGESGTDYGF